jgi:hypothetical protein
MLTIITDWGKMNDVDAELSVIVVIVPLVESIYL